MIFRDGSRRGSRGDFLAGFLLEGAVFGALAYIFAPQKNMSNTPATTAASSSKSKATGTSQALEKRKPLFQKELQHMMYGFGDDQNPLPETVALVEDIVVEYVTDLTHKAQEIGSKRGRLLVDDFLYLIRKDLPKLNRCRELLAMQEELKQARKAFDVDEEKITSLD